MSDVYNSDEPVNIQKCLESFTKEEELSEDELYYCSKCKEHRRASKKLEIWRLPPVLVGHVLYDVTQSVLPSAFSVCDELYKQHSTCQIQHFKMMESARK